MSAKSLLVVDEDPDYRLLVRLALAHDARVSLAGEAADRGEAVRRADELRPELVLLDVDLPGPGPLVVAAELRIVAPDAVVILASCQPGREPLGPEGAALPVLSKGLAPSRLPAELLASARPALLAAGSRDEVSRSFPALLSSAAASRRLVRQALEDWGFGGLVDTAVLLTSEVVTNALVHGRSEVDVSVTLGPDRVRVAVTDTDHGFIRRRRPEETDQSGRGVELVEGMADGWGVLRRGPGKQVWFELLRPPAGA